MEAFELRLWDGRLGRWLSPDPMGQYDSPYIGMGNNPVSMIDPDGGSTESPNDWFKNSKTGEVKWFNSTAEGFSDLNGASWSNTGYGSELLQFNGFTLSYSFQTLTGKNLTDLKLTTYEYDADSGRPTSTGKSPEGYIDLSTFDYSKERQKIKGTGPIPEGNYFVLKNKIQKFDNLSYLNQAYSSTGLGGGFKGGTYAWGDNRFEIYPKKVSIGIGKNKVIRGDFFIHGGQKRGSAGCIDLCGQMNSFVKYFTEGAQNKVHLLVKY